MTPVTPIARFTSGYSRRIVDDELDDLFPHVPAILLDGPKGVGKTATAEQRAQTIHRLHRPQERLLIDAEPERLLVGDTPILVDEWQKVPDSWEAVKAGVDEDASGGRFLLTGSMPPTGTHSGAARITTVRMRPLTLPERGVCSPTVSLAHLGSTAPTPVTGHCDLTLEDYTDLILASGLPGFQHLTGRPLAAALAGYLSRVADTDIVEAGGRRVRPTSVRAWMRAYAAATATTTSWDKIRLAASPGSNPSKTTGTEYRDALTRLRVLDDLDAWLPGTNHLRQAGLAPKHYLADPALAARLLGLSKAHLLSGRGPAARPGNDTFLGALFESLVAMSLRVFASSASLEVFHLRTHRGDHEVDFILEFESGEVIAVEAKLSAVVDDRDVRHLEWLKEQLGDRLLDSMVVTTGSDAYRRRDGISVVPLGLLGS